MKNLIDNLKFEFGGGYTRNTTDVSLKRQADARMQSIADLNTKYTSNENFKDWMDEAYTLGCKAIADFNAANNSTLSVEDGLQICVWGWEEGFEEFTPEAFINCLAEQFHNFI